MLIPKPPAVGDAGVVQELRAVVISAPILGGASAQPRGFMKAVWVSWAAGWIGPWLVRRFTDPLPPTPIYVAVTGSDLRLFSKSLGMPPFEIGRWSNRTYRASLSESGGRLRLDLELARLGRITLFRWSLFGKRARPVFDLVIQNAAGPIS